jgi:putative transposase
MSKFRLHSQEVATSFLICVANQRRMLKTLRYRLFTNRLQADALAEQLGEACRLYNAALQERREAWKQRISINYYDQANQLKQIRASGDLGLANFSCCQDVLRRVNKTFQAFFRRVQRGEKAGYPRFKSRRRYDSITFPSYGDGIKLTGNMLRMQGVGQVEVKLHRPVAGTIKTVTVKRECGEWYACLAVECEPKPLPPLDTEIGMDVGLASFATLSDGQSVPNPRWQHQAEAKLRRAQRRVARRRKGSHRRSKAVALLEKVHQRIRRQRNEFQHKFSFWLVQNFGVIAIENLNIRGLARGMLAKSVYDAGWGSLFSKLAYKAENAGRRLKVVNPRGTSQTCLCGARVFKKLSDREHVCVRCGWIAPRDEVSARLILQRARMSPSNRNVAVVNASVV